MASLFTRSLGLSVPWSLGLTVSWSHSLLALLFLLFTASCSAEEPGDELMFSRSKLLREVNSARNKGRFCGTKWYKAVNPVKWNQQLELAARDHSKDMFDNQFFSHTGSDGKNVDDRIYTQHYFWSACGENVAYGALYEDEVMKEWLKSPGHCVNIMNPAYTEMGAWLTGMYWTQVFAKPQ